MKTCWGSGGVALLILNLDIRCRWVDSFKPRLLYHRIRAPVTPWTGGWVGPKAGLNAMVKKKESHHCPCQELNPGSLARSLVCILTQLSWLHPIWNIIKNRSSSFRTEHANRWTGGHSLRAPCEKNALRDNPVWLIARLCLPEHEKVGGG